MCKLNMLTLMDCIKLILPFLHNLLSLLMIIVKSLLYVPSHFLKRLWSIYLGLINLLHRLEIGSGQHQIQPSCIVWIHKQVLNLLFSLFISFLLLLNIQKLIYTCYVNFLLCKSINISISIVVLNFICFYFF